MKIAKISSLFLLTITSLFLACDPKEETGKYSKGVFITNEGLFNQNNASIDFYNTESVVISKNIFAKENNNEKLGDVLQSMSIIDGSAYLVVNNSNKVEVVNRNTFVRKATINGVDLPRFMEGAGNGKAYLTCWGKDPFGATKKPYIAVISTSDNKVTKTIPFPMNSNEGYFLPENLKIIGTKLFVGDNGGKNQKIFVYNTGTDALVDSIDTAPYSPKSMCIDNKNNLWVLTSSYGVKEGKILKISGETGKVVQTVAITGTSPIQSIMQIDASKSVLFVVKGDGIYRYPTVDGGNQLTSQAALEIADVASIAFTPLNDRLYVGIYHYTDLAKNKVKVYKPIVNTGGILGFQLVSEFGTSGAIPNGLIFQ